MGNWEIAQIRTNEAIKTGLESQRVHQALSARKNAPRKSNRAFLSTKILAIRGFIWCSVENFYCRTLGFFYSRSG
jgi:hypothetical protein